MQFERTSLINRKSHTARVSRGFMAKTQYKAIDRLSGLQLALYVVRRYSLFLSYVGLGGAFFIVGRIA